MLSSADIMILAVLALSMAFGALRGFVSEVLSLAVWVAAFWVAWAFGSDAAAFFSTWLRDPGACLVAGYLGCFLGVVILGAVVGWIVRKMMDGGGLRGGDRFLGMLFGFARGVVLVTFVVFVLGFTAVPRDAAWWHGSMLVPAFEQGAGWFAHELPAGVTQRVESARQALPALPASPISVLPRLAEPSARQAVPNSAAPAERASGHGPARGDVGQ